MSFVNILILGDRKPLNDSDLAFDTLAATDDSVTFLYRGAPYPRPFGVAADEVNITAQIKRIVAQEQIDLIYFRVDWFDKLYQARGHDIFGSDFGVPMVLGYHCHTCHRTPLEAFAVQKADALVLLNHESQSWLESLYGVSKPTALIPSLLLPKRAWYDVPLKSKLSASDGLRHVVIPSNAIRIASVPERLDANVPLENYVLDRYDYLRLCEQLLRRGVVVSIYGKFQVQGETDSALAEQAYRDLAERFSGRLRFPGRVDQRDFATELSQYDAALLTGFVPYQPVPKFDHMNYQVRFNPVLAARLPAFIPAGTTSCGEREIRETGAGFVFDSIDALVDTLRDDGQLARAANAAHSAQDRHSAEAWSPTLLAFFADVLRKNRCSSRAA